MGAAHTVKVFEVGIASNLGVDARRGYTMESWEKHGMCQVTQCKSICFPIVVSDCPLRQAIAAFGTLPVPAYKRSFKLEE